MNTESGEDETIANRFVFCQIIDDGNANNNKPSIAEIPGEPDRLELVRVLTNIVARAQRKPNPDGWVNTVTYKLDLVGTITTTTLLHVNLPLLNSRLKHAGQSSFHNITIGGLSGKVGSTISGDRTMVPD